MTKYRVIYADPPWRFGSKQYKGTKFVSLESSEYPTMTTLDICKLPVNRIAFDDCALFLWTTDAHLPDALKVIEAWGFKYVTVAFIWSKKTKTWKQAISVGAWTMKNCELCLFATRGQMLQHKVVNNVYQLVEAIRTGHSVKPEEVRQGIEAIFGDVPRIELFARRESEGWDVWGDEVESDVEM